MTKNNDNCCCDLIIIDQTLNFPQSRCCPLHLARCREHLLGLKFTPGIIGVRMYVLSLMMQKKGQLLVPLQKVSDSICEALLYKSQTKSKTVISN